VVAETVITTYKRTAAAIATSLFLNSSYISAQHKNTGAEKQNTWGYKAEVKKFV
jgi:hypothetical protein